MSKTTKTKFNQIEKLGELHPPYMNFMGPKTKVEDRLSLNYKGRGDIKRGTENYFLPTTYSDLVSFEHDLLYWSPDNIIKAYADAKFINDIRSIIGYAGIVGQYTRRLGIEGTYNYGIGMSVLMGMKNIFKDFNQIPKIAKDLKDITEAKKSRDTINEILDSVIKTTWQDKTFIELPPKVQKKQLEFTLEKQQYREGFQRLERKIINTFLFKILPKLIFTGYVVAPKILKNVKSIFENVKTFFITNPEYNDIQKRVDKVKDKYEKYLNIVGDFKDAPWYRSLVKTIQQPEGEKFFKIKTNFDKKKAEDAYIEFYNEFVEYQKYMNEKYKDNKDYEPFIIKELNKDNLKKVYDIKDVPASFIEDIFKKYIKKEKVFEGKKFTEEEQNKINELNKEIEKVLKREIETPFEIPAPELEEYKKEKEKEKEIEKVLKGEIEKPFETPIPVELDFFKKLQEEEIKKVLEKEIETPFETPIQLNVPTDADFFKSFQQQQQQI